MGLSGKTSNCRERERKSEGEQRESGGEVRASDSIAPAGAHSPTSSPRRSPDPNSSLSLSLSFSTGQPQRPPGTHPVLHTEPSPHPSKREDMRRAASLPLCRSLARLLHPFACRAQRERRRAQAGREEPAPAPTLPPSSFTRPHPHARTTHTHTRTLLIPPLRHTPKAKLIYPAKVKSKGKEKKAGLLQTAASSVFFFCAR